MIRPAIREDLQRMTEIYNQAILSRRATADTEPFTVEQRKPWFAAHSGRTPVHVYEHEGVVAGYCYLSAYRGRKALEQTAELSYYVDCDYHRMGIAGRLVREMLDTAGRLGYKTLLAIVLSCNEGSIALLQKHGFALWGTFPDVVRFVDAVYSHLYYGLSL